MAIYLFYFLHIAKANSPSQNQTEPTTLEMSDAIDTPTGSKARSGTRTHDPFGVNRFAVYLLSHSDICALKGPRMGIEPTMKDPQSSVLPLHYLGHIIPLEGFGPSRLLGKNQVIYLIIFRGVNNRCGGTRTHKTLD